MEGDALGSEKGTEAGGGGAFLASEKWSRVSRWGQERRPWKILEPSSLISLTF